MAKKRILTEFGMGTSLRRGDYTGACERAIRDALWHNSIQAAPLFGFERDAMIVDVQLAVQRPEAVDTAKLGGIFPYGAVSFDVTRGGLDVPKPDGTGETVIANCAISVSFDMEPAS